MSLPQFIESLRSLYDEMGFTFSQYQKSTKLDCLPSCGACCLNPEVEASILEMLPMAFEIVQKNESELYLEKLSQGKESCIIYQATSADGKLGGCTRYQTRPTLCREFGCAGFRKKDGSTTLSLCKLIKEQHPDWQALNVQDAPLMSDWSMRLLQLDPALLGPRLPINQALEQALYKVLLWQQLHDAQKGGQAEGQTASS